MVRPLPENIEHLEALCHRLSLGRPGRLPTRVVGGLQHQMWRLDTDRGRFAVKQLSRRVDLETLATRDHYNATEAVAEAFAASGIPAVFALKGNEGYLQYIDTTGYLLYPWRDARALDPERLSEQHVSRAAAILAQMHGLNLPFAELRRHSYALDTEENIEFLVGLAGDAGLPFAGTLRRGLPSLLEIVRAQHGVVQQLEHRLVVSHGDLDPKNVLWDARGRPIVIDWESAGRLNPTYEVLLEALNWSGAGSRFEPLLFDAFVAAYREAGGVIEREDTAPAYHCVLGDWVYWMMHNVGRCLDKEKAHDRAVPERQVEFALAALQRIMDHVPALLSTENPTSERVDVAGHV